MSFHNKAIILTGATSALGQAVAKQLSKLGTKLALIDRNHAALSQLQNEIVQQGGEAFIVANDFQAENAAEEVITNASALIGELDILINITSDLSVTNFATQHAAELAQKMYAQSIIPMMMCQAVLPVLLSKQAGHMVNIGNLYGALGLTETACSSANTQALIGFSQALDREHHSQGIKVSFIGARPVKTAMLDDQQLKRAQDKKIIIDAPVKVANAVIDAIHQGKKLHYLGQPESILIWLNRIAPGLGAYFIHKRYQSDLEA